MMRGEEFDKCVKREQEFDKCVQLLVGECGGRWEAKKGEPGL